MSTLRKSEAMNDIRLSVNVSPGPDLGPIVYVAPSERESPIPNTPARIAYGQQVREELEEHSRTPSDVISRTMTLESTPSPSNSPRTVTFNAQALDFDKQDCCRTM